MPGEGRRADGAGLAVLALRPLAAVRVGQLAAVGAAELLPVWQPALVGPPPPEPGLQQLGTVAFEAIAKMLENLEKLGCRCGR